MTDGKEVSDEMLMALADGEVQGADAEELMQRVRLDPALTEKFAVFVETRAILRDAYPATPVPERLVRAIMETPVGDASGQGATVVPLQRRVRATGSLPGLALAASLLLAVGVAGFLTGRGTAPEQVAGDPAAWAAVALAAAETGEIVTLPDGREARALASFETDLGLCRLIGLHDARAVVCRGESGWATALNVAEGDGAAFVPASEAATEVIDALLDRIGAGAPLDGDAERAALMRGD